MFRRIFGKKDAAPTEVPNLEVVCPHTILIPGWDNADDMGNDEKATRFTCESCHQEFTLVEAKGLRSAEAARLNEELTGGTEQTPAN
jgi:hypothetical protein